MMIGDVVVVEERFGEQDAFARSRHDGPAMIRRPEQSDGWDPERDREVPRAGVVGQEEATSANGPPQIVQRQASVGKIQDLDAARGGRDHGTYEGPFIGTAEDRDRPEPSSNLADHALESFDRPALARLASPRNDAENGTSDAFEKRCGRCIFFPARIQSRRRVDHIDANRLCKRLVEGDGG